MHVLMVTDAYPPMRTSCAVQMHDLAQAFVEEGHQVTVITPDSTLKENIRITQQDSVRLVQVKAFETKDINYVSRTIAEFINPFLVWHKLKKSPEFLNAQYDGIIWYSPTIFWGPLIKKLKQQYEVKSYLILRDIFPDWAVDLGLIKKGIIYKFLKAVEFFQYQQADVIGLQSPNNLKYFQKNNPMLGAHIEVLWNWSSDSKNQSLASSPPVLMLQNTTLSGRTIFVYAGNMGVAQGMEALVELIDSYADDQSIGFLLIGRGTAMRDLERITKTRGWRNVLFHEEVASEDLNQIIKQCDVGLIFLDERHRTHNVPGKLLTYLEAGLPVLARLNEGNDLVELIKNEKIGRVWTKSCKLSFSLTAGILLSNDLNPLTIKRAKGLKKKLFSSKRVVLQIAEILNYK